MVELHVKFSFILSDFNEIRIFFADFLKILKFQISWKSVQWGATLFNAVGQAYINVIIAFRNSAKAPKNEPFHNTDRTVSSLLNNLLTVFVLKWSPYRGNWIGLFAVCPSVLQPAVSSHRFRLKVCSHFFFQPALMERLHRPRIVSAHVRGVYMHEGWQPLLLAQGGTLISPWYMPGVSWKFTS